MNGREIRLRRCVKRRLREFFRKISAAKSGKKPGFVLKYENWIAEGCQKYLYERLKPTLVVYLKVSRLTAIWRFTKRFFQARKLVGKQIDPALPVQAYHYRRPTLKKLLQWDADNKIIRQEIEDYLSTGDKCFITIKSTKDLRELFRILDGE